MIKIVLKNGFFYKGSLVREDDSCITIRDIKGKIVEIARSEISVKEVYDDPADS